MAYKRLNCVTVAHFYTIRPKPEPPNHRYSNDYCWKALGSIFDDSCTLWDGARQLNGSFNLRAIKSVKLSSNVASRRLKCVTVAHFYTIRPKTEPPKIPEPDTGLYRNNEIPTTTAGWRALGNIFDGSCTLLNGAS